MFNPQVLIEKEVHEITTIFDSSKYKNSFDALKALEDLAANRKMTVETREIFNSNFYGFVHDIEIRHADAKGLFNYVAKGTAYLSALTADEKDNIYLKKDDTKYSLLLLSDSGKYPSTFNPSTGKCKYPSHWFIMKRVVLANELGNK